MPLIGKKKKRSAGSPLLGLWLNSDCGVPSGYRRLLDSPEIGAAIDRISGIIGSATIYLMANGDGGDVRAKYGLSRFVDVTPWPDMATRQSWVSWIVATMLGPGDGNAYVLPVSKSAGFTALRPLPGASAVGSADGESYTVHWQGRSFAPDEVLHFRLFADPDIPWLGRGYKTRAAAIAASLKQTAALKDNLSSPRYKPPLIVSVSSDTDFSDPDIRQHLREEYLETVEEQGAPWILPEGYLKVDQLKPLSLSDLAVKDTVELDKRTAAAIFGVPPSLLGLGAYSEGEYNNFIRTVIVPICVGIEQELTAKLLLSDSYYFQFNRRRLYAYDLKTLIDMDLAMSDRGFMTGDEVREDAFRDPAGLNEFRVLENYIPFDMAAMQSKLQGGKSNA